MGTASKTVKIGLFFIAAVIATSLTLWASSPPAWAGPTVTICGQKSTLNGSDGNNYKAGASEKLKSDGVPLFATFTTTSNNPMVNSNQNITLIPAPRAGCELDKIVVNTDSECRPWPVTEPPSAPHPVEVHFKNCSSPGQTVYYPDVQADAEALTPPNQLEDAFNASKALLGMNHLTFPSACAGSTEQDLKDCAAAICEGIKDEIENGGAQTLINAGNLGNLMGQLQANLGVCFAKSNYVVVNSGGNGCTNEDIIRTGALDALLAAPAIDLDANLNSDGAGTFTVTNLDGSGDFATINMNTCLADFQVTD